MKAELQKIFNLFEELEEAGETVTLTFTSRGGKSSVKLQLESSTPQPSPSQTSPPAPGHRHRHRGPRARARRNQRAAAHQASLAEAATSVPQGDPPSPRPLHHIASPILASGRRQVTTVAMPDVPTFSTLNVDGPSSPPPVPAPPPPLPPRSVSPIKVQQRVEPSIVRLGNLTKPSNTSGVDTIGCYRCREEFKCCENLEDHILWCPRCGWGNAAP